MLDYLGILVATIAAFIVGALWYGPLFGKKWRMLMNIPEGGMGMGSARLSMKQAMGGGFIATLVLVFVLDSFLVMMGTEMNATAALSLAFWLWLAIAAVMSNVIWYENKPVTLYLINVSHYLATLAVATLVLVYFPW